MEIDTWSVLEGMTAGMYAFHYCQTVHSSGLGQSKAEVQNLWGFICVLAILCFILKMDTCNKINSLDLNTKS